MDEPFHHKLANSAQARSIGIALGAIAVTVILAILFSRNGYQQQQIDTLTQLAKEAQKQTEQLSLQLEELKKANEMTLGQMEMLRSQVEIYENSIKTIQTAEKIDELLNKQNPIPFFKVFEEFSDEKTVGSFYDEGGLLFLENIGSECLIVKLKPNRDNDFHKIAFHKDRHKYVKPGGNLAIIAKHRKRRGKRLDGEELDFDLFYKDADGNHYKQRFYGEADDGKWKMKHSDPTLAVLSD